MWKIFDDRIVYTLDDGDAFEYVSFPFEEWGFDGEIVTVGMPKKGWQGYDDWVQQFSPEEELDLVRETIKKAAKVPTYRAHIRGISLAESTELLRTYYRNLGYEDVQAKSYTLPDTVQVTASTSLRHALWCEKDKKFLHTNDTQGNPYGMVAPPLRGSHDLRVLQQALRMNILMGIEVFAGDEPFINVLVEREILSPFSIGQMIRFRWEKYTRPE